MAPKEKSEEKKTKKVSASGDKISKDQKVKGEGKDKKTSSKDKAVSKDGKASKPSKGKIAHISGNTSFVAASQHDRLIPSTNSLRPFPHGNMAAASHV